MKKHYKNILVLIVVLTTFFIIKTSINDYKFKEDFTIFVPHLVNDIKNYNYSAEQFVETYSDKFKEEYDIELQIEIKYFDSIEELQTFDYSKINTSNYDLILFYKPNTDQYEYLENNFAAEITNQIPNLQNVHEFYLNGYYVPVTVALQNIPLDNRFIYENDIDPVTLTSSQDEYLRVWREWADIGSRYLSQIEFGEIYAMMLDGVSLYDSDNNFVVSDELLQAVKEIRDEVYSGRYYFSSRYKDEPMLLENFENMLLKDNNEDYFRGLVEYEAGFKTSILNVGISQYSINILNSMDIYDSINYRMMLRKPFDQNYRNGIYSYGFLLNKDTNNESEAYDFLNFILSDEIQLEIYKVEGDTSKRVSYPVINSIEEELLEYDEYLSTEFIDDFELPLTDIRTTAFSLIESGEYSIHKYHNYEVERELLTSIVEIIFNDDYVYTNEQIISKLNEIN